MLTTVDSKLRRTDWGDGHETVRATLLTPFGVLEAVTFLYGKDVGTYLYVLVEDYGTGGVELAIVRPETTTDDNERCTGTVIVSACIH